MRLPPPLLTISELTACLKEVLEPAFADLCVVGEVSGALRHRSGHIYFSLKDAAAVCPVVVWKSVALRLPGRGGAIRDGEQVVCRGRLEIYPPSGKYQFIATAVEPHGVGALEMAFRQIQQRLAAEGLFDPARKKPLPRTIRRIAVVTSPSGAAVRDFLQILRRRSRRTSVLLVPAHVQGDGAAEEIAERLKQLNASAVTMPAMNAPDVIVVTRGGGSAEDLAAFNDERIVRAIAASAIPVVSAVGHEIDVTLCDLVADVRALTPSEAAERLVPSDADALENLSSLRRRLDAAWRQRHSFAAARLERFTRHPRLIQPDRLFSGWRQRLDQYDVALERGIARCLEQLKQRLATLATELDALSPESVLRRGYSITCDAGGNTLRSPSGTALGDTITTHLAEGLIRSTVILERDC